MNHDFHKEHLGGSKNQMGLRDDWEVEKESNCILISKSKNKNKNNDGEMEEVVTQL